MQFEHLLEIFDDLKNDKDSEWNSRVKNQRTNLAIIKNDGELFVAPINYVVHFLKNEDRGIGSVKKGLEFEGIIECLKDQGFEEITCPENSDSDEFVSYLSYYRSLPSNDYSNIESRCKKPIVFWVKAKPPTQNVQSVLNAFDTFTATGILDGFNEAKKWFVSHPDTGEAYPAKIIWGIATSQIGREFTAHQTRDGLRNLGFECAKLTPPDFSSGDTQTGPLFEGAERQATRNKRERNPVARKLCIDYYRSKNDGSLACIICKTDFSKIYGDIGEGFIHVHHLDPLAEANGVREVSPKHDLVPVCPNCHAMIHRGSTTRSIAEIAHLMKRNKG